MAALCASPRRATCGGRTPSSTASTSRRSRGDFDGLIDRIDHVADLGATCLWLMPFYPTPNQDDGYDITDYLGVDPRLGDLGDVVEAIRHAHDRGLRVLADLVVNHTSIEHPWFRPPARTATRRTATTTCGPTTRRASRAPRRTTGRSTTRPASTTCTASSPSSPTSTSPTRPSATRSPRPSGSGSSSASSASAWTPCRSCARTSARPRRGTGEGKRWLHALREYAGRRRGDAMLMGEVNVAADELESYFEDHGDALHLQLAFLINQRLWLSLARGEAAPLEDLIRRLPVPPRDSGWATFLRNHDELTLDKLDEAERDEVFAAFGPDEGHADLRPRHPPARGVDARRRRPAAADGVVADALAARDAGDPLRRRDRHGRGPRARGPDGGAHADGVGRGRRPSAATTTRCCSS